MSKKSGDLVSNRRATHDYEIIETFEAGIVLQGTEVKSLRQNHGSLQESYVRIEGGEIWLVGCTINHYAFGNVNNHEEAHDRKLLMHKHEILRLKSLVQEKGMTIIALGLYLKEGRVKIKIAVAKGKKSVDKRASIRERDDKRSMQRVLKNKQSD